MLAGLYRWFRFKSNNTTGNPAEVILLYRMGHVRRYKSAYDYWRNMKVADRQRYLVFRGIRAPRNNI